MGGYRAFRAGGDQEDPASPALASTTTAGTRGFCPFTATVPWVMSGPPGGEDATAGSVSRAVRACVAGRKPCYATPVLARAAVARQTNGPRERGVSNRQVRTLL
jgi:hypothetical protein